MESKVKERYDKLGKDILEAARNELLLSMRFFELVFPMLKPEMSMNTFFMGSDGVILYFNPRFLAERYQYDRIQVNCGYLHTLLHGLFGHIFQEVDYRGEELDSELWNLSCDIATEFMIDQLEYKAVRRLADERRNVIYERLKQELSIIAPQKIYEYFQRNAIDYGEQNKMELLFLVDDHSFWKRKKEGQSEEQQREEQDKLKKQWEDLSEKVENGLETYFCTVGDRAGVFQKLLQIKNRKKQDYGVFLRKFAVRSEEIKVDMDSFDYGFYYFGMEYYGNMPLIEELEYKEEYRINEFVIAIDTSGSCSGEMVKSFIEETFLILKSRESFSEKVNIHIIQCDKEVQQDLVIDDLEKLDEKVAEFQVLGYGGTDFRPVFSYVEQLLEEKAIKHLKGLLYFTDGYGIYPAKNPGYDVVFVFKGDGERNEKIPPWAMSINID